MPITSRDLHTGDILFKHASKGAISQAIDKGQMSHYAADKAELVWDITHQSKITASYGLKNMLNTAVRHEKGLSASSVEFHESALDAWVKSANGGFFSRPSNIKFFCSEFVAFCYMWAAAESKLGSIFGSEYLLGTDKVRISPVEMFTRIETAARSTFQFKGTLYS